MRTGKQADGGFSSSEWKLIWNEFNSNSGVEMKLSQLQSQLSFLKKKYDIFHSMKNNINTSGLF
jgi:hypothetical protein